MTVTETRYYQTGRRDAKGYGARCYNILSGYGRLRTMTTEERAEYDAGYAAGEKARTAHDFNRWQRAFA